MKQQLLCLKVVLVVDLLDFNLLHSQIFVVFVLFFLLFLFYTKMFYRLKHYHQLHPFSLYNNSISSLYSNKLHIGKTISRSFALPISVLLIFVMYNLNGALFLNITSFYSISALTVALTFIPVFTTIYTLL